MSFEDQSKQPLSRPESDALIENGGDRLDRLLEIMRRLRAPDGCPWDREQDFDSIAPYTVEEAYEVADAIERGDFDDLRDELGDLLLQVVYHSQMAEERGAFAFADVLRAVSDKMLRRHPHVFGDAESFDWEAIKAEEREQKARAKLARGEPVPPTGAKGVLDDVAMGLPALSRALKLQARAARVGFDWPETTMVLDKIREESAELVEAAQDGADQDHIEEEMGDLLFVMANLARHLKVDPETALRRANAKFVRRFHAIEAALAAEGRRPEDATLEEMDAHWNAAKALIRQKP